MENSPLTPMETPGETGVPSKEIVDYTEIGSFEASGLLTSEQVADYVRETIPTSHLEGCPGIQYEPDHWVFELFPNGLAFFDTITHEIKVGPAERFREWYAEPNEGIVDAITHEIGHNIHQNFIEQHPDIAAKWTDLYARSGENDLFRATPARTNTRISRNPTRRTSSIRNCYNSLAQRSLRS